MNTHAGLKLLPEHRHGGVALHGGVKGVDTEPRRCLTQDEQSHRTDGRVSLTPACAPRPKNSMSKAALAKLLGQHGVDGIPGNQD